MSRFAFRFFSDRQSFPPRRAHQYRFGFFIAVFALGVLIRGGGLFQTAMAQDPYRPLRTLYGDGTPLGDEDRAKQLEAEQEVLPAEDVEPKTPLGSPEDLTPLGSPVVIESIFVGSRRGPFEMGRAIEALTRLNRFQEIDQLLSTVDGSEQAALVQIGRGIGTAMRFRLRFVPITEASLSKIDAMEAAIKLADRDPAQLNAAIEQVIAQSPKRNQAIRRLSIGGHAAIAAIWNRILDPRTTTVPPDLIRTALAIDSNAADALVQAALYGNTTQSERAVRLLAAIDSQRYASEILAATTDDFQLTRSHLVDRFNVIRSSALRSDRHTAIESVWTLMETGLTSVSTSGLIADYRRAVDAAAAIDRLEAGAGVTWGPSQPDSIASGIVDVNAGYREHWISRLNARYAYQILVDPEWIPPSDFAQQQPLVYRPEVLASMIREAIKMDDDAALLAAVRVSASMIVNLPDVALADPDWLQAMVAASRWSNASVRFEAALVLGQTFGDSFYVGKSYVRQGLAEMVRLSSRPTVLIVETRIGLSEFLRAQLGELGYRVEVVSSVAELLRRLERGGDLRMIVSKRQLADYPPIELVDRVRRRPKTRSIPILFYEEPVFDDELGFYSKPASGFEQLTEAMAYSQPSGSLEFGSPAIGSPAIGSPGIGSPGFESPGLESPGMESLASEIAETLNAPLPPVDDLRFGMQTRSMEFPKTAGGWEPMLREIDSRRRIPPLTASDRNLLSKLAAEVLN